MRHHSRGFQSVAEAKKKMPQNKTVEKHRLHEVE